MKSVSTTDKMKLAECWWFVIALTFGMFFFSGLADAWFVYGVEYSPEQKLWWAALSLTLLLCERIAYAHWRKLSAEWVAEVPWSTNVGGILKI